MNLQDLITDDENYNSINDYSSEDVRSECLLCIWSIQEPSQPQHILSCSSTPTAAAFSPGKPTMVVSGFLDGSLAAWDLREQTSLHQLAADVDGNHWKIRVPSFISGKKILHLSFK